MSAIGYDFGNHSSYVALVRTGGIDTVDNDFSYRATPTVVSFSDLMRFTGNAAKSQIVTNYKNTYFGFRNLIGLDFDDPVAQFEMSLIPSNFIKLPDGKIGLETEYLGFSIVLSIFQLVAALMSDLKKTTLMHVPKVGACVFSVPNYFSETQRRAFLCSCEVAGFNPSALISDTTAVCLNYVLFKTDLPKDNETPRIVTFVDVGYSSVQVCIAAFNGSKVKVIASQGSNQFGGRMFDRLLHDKFSSEFKKKHNIDPSTNLKAYLKLLNECEGLKKQINSTSTELPLKIECFMNDIDFMAKTSRDELDQMAESLFKYLHGLLVQTLETAKLKASDIHSVEAVGGSSRLLGVRNVIAQVFGKEASTTLNADEAVARGCAIKCALISPVVRIREIDFKDLISHDYTVHYISRSGENKMLKVYQKYDPIPAKKELVFPPMTPFSFSVSQTDMVGNSRIIGSCEVSDTIPSETAEKLTFWCNVDLSSLYSVVKAFYTFVKDDDTPSKDQPDNNNLEKKPRTIKVNNEIKYNFKYTQDFQSLIPEYQKLESEFLNQIETERNRSTAKNTLEEFIYSSRDACEGSTREYMNDQEYSSYMADLTNEENWLYEEGEHQSAEVYQSRLQELQNKFYPFKSRKTTFEVGRSNIESLFSLLMHYRKYMDVFSREPQKYEHLTPAEIDEYSQKIAQADKFVFEADNVYKTTPKCKLPSIPSNDIVEKLNEMNSYCNTFVKKAENPPPKPPSAQQQKQDKNNDVNCKEPAQPTDDPVVDEQ